MRKIPAAIGMSFLLCLSIAPAVSAGWTWSLPKGAPTGAGSPKLARVVHGNGQFLAMSDSGRFFASNDGTEWSERPALPASRFFELIFARGRFHALDCHGIVFSSADGTDWTKSSIGYSYTYTLAEGGGKFLVSADNGLVFLSDSLKSWTRVQPLLATDSSAFANVSTLKVIHDGKRFVSGSGYAAGMSTSIDGKYWRWAGCNRSEIGDIVVHDTVGMAISSLASVCRSLDGGASWSVASATDAYAVTWADTSFVAVGDWGKAWTTTVGLTWKPIVSATGWQLLSVAYGDGALVAVGTGGTIVVAKSDPVAGIMRTNTTPSDSRLLRLARGSRTRLVCGMRGSLSLFSPEGRQILSRLPVEAGEEVAIRTPVRGLLVARLAGATGSVEEVLSIP